MAITNAQQYQQLVNKPANGKRPGYRGIGGYQSGRSGPSSRSSSRSTSTNQGPAGGASAGGNYGGNRNPNQTTNIGGGSNRTNRLAEEQRKKEAADLATAKKNAKIKADKIKADAAKAIADKKAKAIADKKAKDLSNVGKSKTSKFGTVVSSLKEKNKKFQNKKNIDLANKRAFQKYQDIEQYVDMMDDYGLSAEELADKVKANETYGYDFSDLDKGLENLVSNKGTSIESIRKNLYDVNSPMFGITGLLTNKIRPDTQVTALNTLRKARDYRDLAGTGDVSRDDLDNLRNRGKTQEQIDIMDGNVRDNDPYIPPIISQLPVVGSTTSSDPFSLAPRFMGSIFDFSGPQFAADGGIMRTGAMDGGRMRQMEMMEDEDDPTGGIMDLESGRQMYFLGKLVKKATRAVKKVAKSPFGKAALLYGLGSLGAGALGQYNAGTGSGFFSGLKGKLFGKAALGAKSVPGMGSLFKPATKGLLGKLGITKGAGSFMPTLKGGIGLGLGIPFALDALGVGKEEDDGMDLDEYYRTQGINIADIRNNPYNYLSARNQGSKFAADGGLMRNGYQEGGDAEPVAKKTMPLIDMDGMEKDYRADGGFVPIGRMERADDVPARLSKNEFVFTADAVRNAGDGDIDKGAEVMYNMMKNLESGGEVSEESQGLDGAREMFQTSQRLEEVL